MITNFNLFKFSKEFFVYILFFLVLYFYFFISNTYFNLFNLFIILLFCQLLLFFFYYKKNNYNLLHKYITDISQCQFILSIIFGLCLYDSLNLDISNKQYYFYNMYFFFPILSADNPILISFKIDWISFFFLS